MTTATAIPTQTQTPHLPTASPLPWPRSPHEPLALGHEEDAPAPFLRLGRWLWCAHANGNVGRWGITIPRFLGPDWSLIFRVFLNDSPPSLHNNTSLYDVHFVAFFCSQDNVISTLRDYVFLRFTLASWPLEWDFLFFLPEELARDISQRLVFYMLIFLKKIRQGFPTPQNLNPNLTRIPTLLYPPQHFPPHPSFHLRLSNKQSI